MLQYLHLLWNLKQWYVAMLKLESQLTYVSSIFHHFHTQFGVHIHSFDLNYDLSLFSQEAKYL